MNVKKKIREFKEWYSKNKTLAIVGGLAAVVVIAIFIKMFIDLLPYLLLGLGAFIIYKMYKRGWLG